MNWPCTIFGLAVTLVGSVAAWMICRAVPNYDDDEVPPWIIMLILGGLASFAFGALVGWADR